MDNDSMNSMNNNSMGKIFSSNETTNDDHASPEESGWTMYFNDFFNQHNETSCFSSAIESSLISDPAFSAVRNNHKAVAGDDNEQVTGFSRENPCDRFTSRKRKTKVVDVDDDLEDTASSPANSPKVCNLMSKYYDRKPVQNNTMDISQEKASSSTQIDHHERRGEGVSVGRDKETELKKRGLCLVPLSMIVDYLG